MPELVHRYDEPAWLPARGTAQVWRATSPDVPDPLCVARLLATDELGRIFVVEREDGGGWDIPSAVVRGRNLEEVIDDLVCSVPVPVTPPGILGWVRNVVTADVPGYRWPVPYAHFALWTARADGSGEGRWLDRTAAEPALGRRHWWPLAPV